MFEGEEIREVFRVIEDQRQRSLTRMLGQVTCEGVHRASRLFYDPCPACGAAL